MAKREMSLREVALLEALKATLSYLPNCKGKEGSDCGPGPAYKAKCPYMKARKIIEQS